MFFKPVAELEKNDKRFFIEGVEVYIRLVEVFCEKNNIKNDEDPILTPEAYEELLKIGVINNRSDIGELKKALKKKYDPFIKAVKFCNKHEKDIHDTIWKLYNSKRREVQKEANNKHNLTLVDFFCGAGGLSLGFLQEGFNVKLASDIEPVCIQTYKYNHPELNSSKLIQEDIREFIHDIKDYIDEPIDIIVGGPPCQGFSTANQRRIIDDPRNELYKYFLEMVKIIGPKFVVMENVKGMLKVADQVVEDYGAIKIKQEESILSYNVSYEVLKSNEFSVAQNRQRLIYIAVRSDICEELNLSPEDIFVQINENNKGKPIYTLHDALKDIKPLDSNRIKNSNNVDSETAGKKIDVNDNENHNNPYLDLINNNRKIPYLFNHKARYCNDNNYEIYRRLDQGDDATNEKIKDIMLYSRRNHIFKDKYFKLFDDRPCRTITAHLKVDGHSHIHPFQVRSITPREAARVQSFPDDYFFLGSYTKTYMQIGNAVPPVMARGIAKIIKKYLEKLFAN